MSTEAAAISSVSVSHSPLSREELRKLNAYWRAANYLSVGQIYLYTNPLLRKPLKLEHIKPRLPGPWGTTPGLNFIYVHFNRLIKKYLDRYHLAGDVVDRVPRLQRVGAHFKQWLRNRLVEHKQYIRDHGEDMAEIRDWRWPY
jgi:phosphoketolase